MTQTLSSLCEDLHRALACGEINTIPKISFKIKQTLSRHSTLKDGKAEFFLEGLSQDVENQKKIIETVRTYVNWVQSLKSLNLKDLQNNSEEFKILVGEINIPLIWDFAVDPVFIDQDYPYAETLIQFLKENKQENIFSYSNGTIIDEKDKQKFSIFDAPKYFDGLRRVLGINCQFISQTHRSEQKEFIQFLVQTMSDIRSRRNTIIHFNKIWHQNQIAGLATRLNGYTHNELKDIFFNRHVLIVSPGPSLEHFINFYNEEVKENFLLVALAQSMPALNKFKIIPHFVMVVDPLDFSHVLDNCTHLKHIDLIAEESVHVNFITKGFRNLYTIITNKDHMGLSSAFNLDPMDLDGGTVALSACSLAAKLRSKSITLVGQDLAISRSNYFVKAKLTEKRVIKKKNEMFIEWGDEKIARQEVIPVTGWEGEALFTTPEYAVYLHQFESFAQEYHNMRLYNSSVGGVNIKGFKNKDLPKVLQKVANDNTDVKQNSKVVRADLTVLLKKYNFDKAILNRMLRNVGKIKKILMSSNRETSYNLKKIDKLEKKIIKLSKENTKISAIVSDIIIRLNRNIVYVSTLKENLNLSLKFYEEVSFALEMYKGSLVSGILTLKVCCEDVGE